jgi:hypothetical protein
VERGGVPKIPQGAPVGSHRAQAAREDQDGGQGSPCRGREEFGRKYRLKARYGLTLEDYDAILKQQGGVCLFCDRKTEAHLDVDHCHVTGLVRALLCRSCNAGLGNFGENPVIIGRAARFMELWVQYVFELCNREESNMASDKIVSGKNEITRAPSTPMRDAILHELNQPICGDRPLPINGLQAVARALVIKAGAQDIQAIKEVLDRIDGRPPSASADDQSRRLLNVTWTHALSKLKSSTQGVPKGRSPKGRKRVGRRIKQSAIRPNAQAKRSSSRLCRPKKGRGTSREA